MNDDETKRSLNEEALRVEVEMHNQALAGIKAREDRAAEDRRRDQSPLVAHEKEVEKRVELGLTKEFANDRRNLLIASVLTLTIALGDRSAGIAIPGFGSDKIPALPAFAGLAIAILYLSIRYAIEFQVVWARNSGNRAELVTEELDKQFESQITQLKDQQDRLQNRFDELDRARDRVETRVPTVEEEVDLIVKGAGEAITGIIGFRPRPGTPSTSLDAEGRGAEMLLEMISSTIEKSMKQVVEQRLTFRNKVLAGLDLSQRRVDELSGELQRLTEIHVEVRSHFRKLGKSVFRPQRLGFSLGDGIFVGLVALSAFGAASYWVARSLGVAKWAICALP